MEFSTSDLEGAERQLWILLLLIVPISASPLLPFGAGTLVRPLSFIPAILLLAIAAYRILFLGQALSLKGRGGWLLTLFTLYAVIAGLAHLSYIPDDSFKGQTPLNSFVRALATLAVGLVFYWTARLNIRSADDVQLTLRWLFIGLAASIAFAVIQVIAIVAGGDILYLVQRITDLIALHREGLQGRAQGFTYEPSFLATQILLLMLPPLVARIIARQAYPGAPQTVRDVWIAVLGFTVALTGLLCAGSRFGIVAALLMLMLGGAMALWRGRIVAAAVFAAALLAGGGGIAALGAVSAGAGASYVLGPFAYLTDTSQLTTASDTDVSASVTDAFSLAGRAAAGQAAFDLWRDNPLFGVSLGNDYRYFGRYAPDWAYDSGLFTLGTQEGLGWVDPGTPEKGNAKNLFLRLLSETGLIGFVLFGCFFWRQIFSSAGHDHYTILFRLAAAAALLFSAVNQDSFADPAMWIVLVLCATMGQLQAAPRSDPGKASVAAPS